MTPLPWPRRRNQQQGASFNPGSKEPPHQHRDRTREPDTGTRQVRAGRDSVAAGGNIARSALGPNSTVTNIREQHIHPASAEPVAWPLRIGEPPPTASAFQPRAELRARVDAARQAGGAVVLTQVLAGGGGVGKTQLAAAYAAEALQDGAELVVWVPAGEEQQVVAGYAQAAVRVQAPGADGQDPTDDAKAFLAWLATTKRRWLVVLDDISDPQAVHAWWPAGHTSAGWVLATTRLHDARLTGGGRRRVHVDVYTPDESHAYLRSRLNGDGVGHLLDDQAQALSEALGHLPLAIAHAAAYMINQQETCTRYLQRLNDRDHTLDQVLPTDADAESYGRTVTTTLLLALDAADRTEPTGLATPILRLAALLDPAGHPADLWNTNAVLAHLNHQSTPTSTSRRRLFRPRSSAVPEAAVTPDQVQAVLRTLHRYALLTVDTTGGPRGVRIHALTARASRETGPESLLPELAVAAAHALVEGWPELDQTQPALAAVLRANSDTLHQHAGDHLWQLENHTVLFRAGASLVDAGLSDAASRYWHRTEANAQRLLGPDHPSTLTARGNLAASYNQAGRTGEAIDLQEHVLSDRERLQGPDHPDTLTARGNLASIYGQAGRTDEALALKERVLADRERLLGPDHPDTLLAAGNLAFSYWDAGRLGEAIIIEERVLADRERLLGPDHPDTVLAASNLASSYQAVGRTDEALELQQRALADSERVLGPDHPDTLTARVSLASIYGRAGRTDEALGLKERVLADSERVLGPDHPDTLTARVNLALSYHDAGRTAEAIDLQERVLADSQRVLSSDHPDTLTAAGILAVFYRETRRTNEAISLGEQALADTERVLGPDHPDTLTARANLGITYWAAGRLEEAIEIEEQALAETERALGPDHPDALTARANLAVTYRDAGRTHDAIDLQEQVLASQEQFLVPDHPDTLATRRILQDSRTQQSASLPAAGEAGTGDENDGGAAAPTSGGAA